VAVEFYEIGVAADFVMEPIGGEWFADSSNIYL